MLGDSHDSLRLWPRLAARPFGLGNCRAGRRRGSALLIEGRTDDVLAFRAGNGQIVRVLPLALFAVAKETPGVNRMQAFLSGLGLTSVEVVRAPEPPQRDPRSGKFRHVYAEKGTKPSAK